MRRSQPRRSRHAVARNRTFPDPVWAHRALQSLRLYPDFVAELRRESRHSIDYTVCGAVESGREFPGEAIVDPRDLGCALRHALDRHRVQLLEHRTISSIEVSGGVKAEKLRARTVVIAAGAWSGQIQVNGQTLPATVPVKGYLLGYEGTPQLGPIRRDGHTYILQRSNGSPPSRPSVSIAKSSLPLWRTYKREPEPYGSPSPNSRPSTFGPACGPPRNPAVFYTERWDEQPLWLAYGHYRNGILLAPWTANYLAGQIADWLGW